MFRNVGLTLKVLRELRAMSQAALARKAGIGRSQLSKYERGKELPKLDSLEKVLAALALTSSDFFSTLEVFDRCAARLGGGGDSLFESAPALRRTRLLSDTVSRAFERLAAEVLHLHQSILLDPLVQRGWVHHEREQEDTKGERR